MAVEVRKAIEATIYTKRNGERWILIHGSGCLYRMEPDREPEPVVRFKVEECGIRPCLEMLDVWLGGPPATGKGHKEQTRACDTPGCGNPAESGRLIAPATQVRICRECAGRFE